MHNRISYWSRRRKDIVTERALQTPHNSWDKGECGHCEAGAGEVWICGLDGTLRFFSTSDQNNTTSTLCPDFPTRIELDAD